MDDGVLHGIVAKIKAASLNVSTSHKKHYLCQLKNDSTFNLWESAEAEFDVSSNGKQIHITYSNLFKSRIKCGKTILLRGEAGVGKSTLCSSITEDWASGKLFQEFFIVLLLPLSLRNVASANSLSELINTLYNFEGDNFTSIMKYLKDNRDSKVLILADGWDVLEGSQCQTGSFLYSLLFGDALPSSCVTVVITSRTESVQIHTLQSFDRFVTLRGFDKETVESSIQLEFDGDVKRVHYLMAELNNSPAVESLCSIPLNLAIICSMCRFNDTQPLPNTMTELYTKMTWALASICMKNSVRFRSASGLSSYHDLPGELQQLWWSLCELAFRNIEKGHIPVHVSPLDVTSSELEMVSYFGLLKPTSEIDDGMFIHPRFEEYLASLHLAKQSQDTQLRFIQDSMMRTDCGSRSLTTFWHFFISNYVRVVIRVNPDIIVKVLKLISSSTNKRRTIDLCRCSFEAKSQVVSREVVKVLSSPDSRTIHFGHPHDLQDYIAIVYVMENIEQECSVEINLQDSSLKAEHIDRIANVLGEKSGILQVKGLNLSRNRLDNSLVVDFFCRAAVTFKSLKILILRDCGIGTNADIKAILEALIKSCCKSLTHLDLSFNPISLSFLKSLKHHLDSHSTFAALKNFNLKASIPKDVSTSFLADFSCTLSSRCPHLQRLDLSDNYLGEPGNPDLSKVISYLLDIRTDFNLCLNKEYMSEVDDKFICVMEESIKNKGTIDHTIAHGVIVGPGRSGKNTLMSRLMGNGPPEADSSSPSTGVLENIVKVEVKKLDTVATAVSDLNWKSLKYDEEALELIMTTAKYHSVVAPVSKITPSKFIVKEEEKQAVTVEKASALPSKAVVKHKRRKKYNIMVLKILKKLRRPKATKSYAKRKKAVVYTPDVEPVDIFKRAVQLRGMDALREHLESSWSLYLTNTGGQIEFQEHLPLLVCGPSIFFVVFPLHYDLEKPYDICYEYPDGQKETYKSPGTLLEELLQTLATINVSNYTSGQQSDTESNIKPKVFFVGTHKDCLPASAVEETIQEKEKVLQKYVRQTSLFHQGSLQFAQPPEQLIFTVNNHSKHDEDFQKIRSAVQQTVERNQFSQFTVKCPSSWLIFSLILRAKHKSDQVLSFDRCFQIARECGISDHREMNQALSFIHSRLGLIRYFNTEELNSLVVIDPQVIFDRISDLIVKTFTTENVEANEIEEFCQRGIISVAVMEKISNKCNSDSLLPFTWLTKLLNYLRIAALFADQDGEKYFFPSAICHVPEPHSRQPAPSDSPPPLLVGFESGFCPRGIPGALIKYLMTNEMKSRRLWKVLPDKIFRNQVSFRIQTCGIITLRIFPTHLEIFRDTDTHSEVNLSKDKLQETCEVAYRHIREGMKTVTSQCRECKYFFGFYCTLSTCKAHRHPAKLEWDGDTPFNLECTVGVQGDLPNGYKIWNIQKRWKQGKTNLNKVIDADNSGIPKHLGQIADSLAEWEGRIADGLTSHQLMLQVSVQNIQMISNCSREKH